LPTEETGLVVADAGARYADGRVRTHKRERTVKMVRSCGMAVHGCILAIFMVYNPYLATAYRAARVEEFVFRLSGGKVDPVVDASGTANNHSSMKTPEKVGQELWLTKSQSSQNQAK